MGFKPCQIVADQQRLELDLLGNLSDVLVVSSSLSVSSLEFGGISASLIRRKFVDLVDHEPKGLGMHLSYFVDGGAIENNRVTLDSEDPWSVHRRPAWWSIPQLAQ